MRTPSNIDTDSSTPNELTEDGAQLPKAFEAGPLYGADDSHTLLDPTSETSAPSIRFPFTFARRLSYIIFQSITETAAQLAMFCRGDHLPEDDISQLASVAEHPVAASSGAVTSSIPPTECDEVVIAESPQQVPELYSSGAFNHVSVLSTQTTPDYSVSPLPLDEQDPALTDDDIILLHPGTRNEGKGKADYIDLESLAEQCEEEVLEDSEVPFSDSVSGREREDDEIVWTTRQRRTRANRQGYNNDVVAGPSRIPGGYVECSETRSRRIGKPKEDDDDFILESSDAEYSDDTEFDQPPATHMKIKLVTERDLKRKRSQEEDEHVEIPKLAKRRRPRKGRNPKATQQLRYTRGKQIKKVDSEDDEYAPIELPKRYTDARTDELNSSSRKRRFEEDNVSSSDSKRLRLRATTLALQADEENQYLKFDTTPDTGDKFEPRRCPVYNCPAKTGRRDGMFRDYAARERHILSYDRHIGDLTSQDLTRLRELKIIAAQPNIRACDCEEGRRHMYFSRPSSFRRHAKAYHRGRIIVGRPVLWDEAREMWARKQVARTKKNKTEGRQR